MLDNDDVLGGERLILGSEFTDALESLARTSITSNGQRSGLAAHTAAGMLSSESKQLPLQLDRCSQNEFIRASDGKHMWKLECEVHSR